MTELGSARVAKFGLHIQLPSIDAPTPRPATKTFANDPSLASPNQPPIIRSSASTSRLQDIKSSKYNIDINTLQRNIDRLALGDHAKGEVLTPKDLYRKAHPGLASNSMDYTDPRQWYSSSATKKMMKKFASNYQPTRTVPPADRNMGTGQVAFFVTFPNIRQAGERAKEFEMGRGRPNRKSADSDCSIKRFPDIQSKGTYNKLKLEHSMTNIPIKHFNPNIDKSARSYKDKLDYEIYASTESLENIGSTTKNKKATKMRSKSNTPDTEKRSTPIPRIEFVIPTANGAPNTVGINQTMPFYQRQASQTSSAVHRDMTESVEDILKSVTNIRGDETLRSLKQPPSTSLELPVIESNAAKGEVLKSPKESPKQTQQKHSSMRKAVSYQNVKATTDSVYVYEEVPNLAKAESMESLLTPTGGSRDKYMQLCLPKQRSEVEEINYFRDTYSLRQKSNLNLKTTANGVSADKRRSSTILITDRSANDHSEVVSKIGPYIHGKIPDHYLVIPDSNGEPQAVGLPTRTPEPLLKSGTSNKYEQREKMITSVSDMVKDASSEAHTLGTVSVLSHGAHTGAQSLSNEVIHPRRSMRSPRAKRTSMIPDDTQSTPANPPPSQLSSIKPYCPSRPRKSKTGKYLAISDSCLYKIDKEKSVVNISMTQNQASKPHVRRKTLVRAIDRYIQEKLGDRLKEQEDLAVQIVIQQHRELTNLDRVTEQNTPASTRAASQTRENTLMARDGTMHPLLRQNTRIKVPKSKINEETITQKGKRGVFRVKKMVTPFPERDRPTTMGRSEPVVYEDYLDKKKYKPQLRPPTFRLDLRQYPPHRPSISRDISYDKHKSVIIEHSLERTLTECDLKFPSRIASGVVSNQKTTTGDSLKPPEQTTTQPRNKRTPGNGGSSYIEFHIVSKSREGAQQESLHNAGGFSLDPFMKSTHTDEQDADTPVDSLDASMMKEIYDNLDSYLVTMNSRGHDGMTRERSYEDMMME